MKIRKRRCIVTEKRLHPFSLSGNFTSNHRRPRHEKIPDIPDLRGNHHRHSRGRFRFPLVPLRQIPLQSVPRKTDCVRGRQGGSRRDECRRCERVRRAGQCPGREAPALQERIRVRHAADRRPRLERTSGPEAHGHAPARHPVVRPGGHDHPPHHPRTRRDRTVPRGQRRAGLPSRLVQHDRRVRMEASHAEAEGRSRAVRRRGRQPEAEDGGTVSVRRDRRFAVRVPVLLVLHPLFLVRLAPRRSQIAVRRGLPHDSDRRRRLHHGPAGRRGEDPGGEHVRRQDARPENDCDGGSPGH